MLNAKAFKKAFVRRYGKPKEQPPDLLIPKGVKIGKVKKETLKKPKWWPKTGARKVIPEVLELERGYWLSWPTHSLRGIRIGGTS